MAGIRAKGWERVPKSCFVGRADHKTHCLILFVLLFLL